MTGLQRRVVELCFRLRHGVDVEPTSPRQRPDRADPEVTGAEIVGLRPTAVMEYSASSSSQSIFSRPGRRQVGSTTTAQSPTASQSPSPSLPPSSLPHAGEKAVSPDRHRKKPFDLHP